MNERIRELAEQAEQYAQNDLNERRKVNGPLYAEGEYEDIIKQKFAELIVRECADIADDYDGVGSTIVSRIKQHFGIEPGVEI